MKSLKMILVLAFCFGFLEVSFCQPDTLWTRMYESVDGYISGKCVVESSDSGFVILGNTGENIYLLKTNSLGDSLWSKTYGGTGNEVGNSLQQTADDGFIILGTTSSYGSGQNDIWLLKTDEYGDTIWTKTFGDTGMDYGTCIQINQQGGYIIAGGTNSGPWLIRTDLKGDTIWTKTYANNILGGAEYVIQTTDMGYLITGNAYDAINDESKVMLFKTDSYGDIQWTNYFNINTIPMGSSFGTCLIEDTNGYVITAIEAIGFLLKTDFSGDTLWTRSVSGTFHTSHLSIVKTIDGSYLIGRCGLYLDNFGSLLMTDSKGNILWEIQFLGDATHGSGILSVIQTRDSCYIATGYNMDRLYLVKVTSTITGLKNNENTMIKDFSFFQNYPNPFNPSTTIEFTLPKSEFVELKVYNILGKEVSTLVSNKLNQGNHTYTFDGKNLASGIYYYQLIAGDFREVKKMILLR